MSDLETTAPADLLIKLLERQHALAEQLAGLADRQATLIDARDTDDLLVLLTQRQRIMDQFTAGQDSLARLSEAARQAEPSSPDMNRRIGTLMEDISDRLTGIMRLDERDRDLLETNRDSIGDALNGLAVAREARQAYLGGRTVTNRFADHRG